MNHPDLFEPPEKPKRVHQMTRKTDPATSLEAAARILPTLRDLQAKVYAAIERAPGGMTNLDIETHFNNSGSTYRTRTSELVQMGLVVDSGERRFQRGSSRIVWRAKWRLMDRA